MLAEFEPGILEVVDEFFADSELSTTITYKVYLGTTNGVESFETFSLPAICSNHVTESKPAIDNTRVQGSVRQYIIREAHLPQGITRNSLGKNDKILVGTQTLDIVDFNKDLGFLIAIIAQGA